VHASIFWKLIMFPMFTLVGLHQLNITMPTLARSPKCLMTYIFVDVPWHCACFYIFEPHHVPNVYTSGPPSAEHYNANLGQVFKVFDDVAIRLGIFDVDDMQGVEQNEALPVKVGEWIEFTWVWVLSLQVRIGPARPAPLYLKIDLGRWFGHCYVSNSDHIRNCYNKHHSWSKTNSTPSLPSPRSQTQKRKRKLEHSTNLFNKRDPLHDDILYDLDDFARDHSPRPLQVVVILLLLGEIDEQALQSCEQLP
jgi:hypothetical protein